MLNLRVIGTAQENNQLTWITTTKCNFACEYCDKSPIQYTDWNYIKEINKHINYLIITGGECTLYKDLDKIIEHSQVKMKLWSNLTADLNYYLYLLDLNPLLQEIYTSYHPAFTDYESWLNKIKVLSQKVQMYANVMYENKDNVPLSPIREYVDANYGYIVGLDYYKNKPDLSLFYNEKYCTINGTDYYFLDRNKLQFRTKAVKCDINKKRLNLVIDKYKICCYTFNDLEKALSYNILCSNQICTTMFLRRGNKNGLFEKIKCSYTF